MNRCLICYKEISSGENYHQKCIKKLFETTSLPELSFDKSKIKEMAKNIVSSSITIPGVQSKISLHYEKHRKEGKLTIVGVLGNYILKPQSDLYPELPENESLTMKLAAIVKIPVVPNGLIKLTDGSYAYITRRIDRDSKTGKLAMEDMCQLTERLTEDKYKGSVEQIGKIIRKYSSTPLLDLQIFFEMVLFSYITGNSDMHLKNYSLLTDINGSARLSPGYDLLNTKIVLDESVDPEESALTINAKKNKIKKEDFLKLAETLKLGAKQTENTFKKFTLKIPEMQETINHSFLSENMKGKYTECLLKKAENVLY